ncbi:MAG TPA: sugar ABC transporter substrate-binding protein [Armatimonadetes bacterium]|nr:sugar ABC transporter substrate-binding protein [Armatimonadota bacterium]
MRRLHSVAWAALAGLFLAACSTPQSTPPPSATSAPLETGQAPGATATGANGAGLTIAVVPKAVSQQFWNAVKDGAEAAAKEAGATVLWKGPSLETDVNGQKGIVEDFVTQKVDAIVLAATDADALVPTIEKAEAAGVPVITIDSGVNYANVRSLVATDNQAGGQLGGEKLIELIGGEGEVGLIPFVKGAASSEAREAGFKAAVEATGGKVKLVSTLYSESSIATAAKVADDMMTANPNLKGIFAANESGTVGAANAVKAKGKAGEILVVGFDGSKEEVAALQDGSVQALVLQDPFKMGGEGVKQAILAARGEAVEKLVDTGVLVVTKDNLDSEEAKKLLGY